MSVLQNGVLHAILDPFYMTFIGQWRVDVIDSKNRILGTREFEILDQ